MKESTKNQSILLTDHQRGHYVELVIALFVKMQTKFTSHLKRQSCENGKGNTNCSAIYQELILTLITPEQTKLSIYWICLSD